MSTQPFKVSGGIDAESISINGVEVIDSSGNVSGGSGTGLGSRVEKSVTISYDPGVTSGVGTISSAYKGYAILKIETTAASWVRVYTSQAARTADASRDISVDPDQGAGVIAEIITTGAETVIMSPGVIGFNDESTPTDEIYVAVENNAIETPTITVTLTLLPLEA